MPGLKQLRFSRLLTLLVAVIASHSAQAHLIEAQHGALNITSDGVFMVLSVPASAFYGIDDNNDERLSAGEIQAHHSRMLGQIENGLALLVDGTPQRLNSPLITPTFGHGNPAHSASQIVITGRFAMQHPNETLAFQASLFGSHKDEQRLSISIKRPAQAHRQTATLTPQQNQVPLMIVNAATAP